jgi:hypothetical protein
MTWKILSFGKSPATFHPVREKAGWIELANVGTLQLLGDLCYSLGEVRTVAAQIRVELDAIEREAADYFRAI